MASSRRLITSTTLSSSAASVTFSSIPSTYTDLVLRISARGDLGGTSGYFAVRFNSDTATNYSYTDIEGTGSAASSARNSSTTFSTLYYGYDRSGATASTFGNAEIYIPSYTANQNKPLGYFGVSETNATAANMATAASLWRNTSAINNIDIYAGGVGGTENFVSGSTFTLYGLKNS